MTQFILKYFFLSLYLQQKIIYIYIVIHGQTVSLYHNFSAWLYIYIYIYIYISAAVHCTTLLDFFGSLSFHPSLSFIIEIWTTCQEQWMIGTNDKRDKKTDRARLNEDDLYIYIYISMGALERARVCVCVCVCVFHTTLVPSSFLLLSLEEKLKKEE